jgi:hypothetical protein
MGTSSFGLMQVSAGYVRVLWRLLLKRIFGIGAYKSISFRKETTSAS